jgi:integrase
MKKYLIKNGKSPYWQVLCKGDKITTASTQTTDRKEAEKFLASYIPQKKHKAETLVTKTSISLSKFFEEYKTYINNTYSVKYLKKAVIPSFVSLQKHLPDIPLENISSRNIDQYISSVFSNSKYAASMYYRTLKAAFNKAVVWNYIEVNPFSKIKTPKTPSSLPVYISEAELIQILDKVENQLYKDIFTTAYYTGMRLNELLNMKWDWIDFNQNFITIKNSNQFITKNKRERVIPIHPRIDQILNSRFPFSKEKENHFVFYRVSGVKLNGEFISKQFKKGAKAAKLNPKIHFHTLRHSFASALVQRKVDIYTVQKLLGHNKIQTTQIYSHLQKENLSQAVNLL